MRPCQSARHGPRLWMLRDNPPGNGGFLSCRRGVRQIHSPGMQDMTETTLSPARTDPRIRRNLAILILAQAFLGAQMPMIFTVAGLAGQSLASNLCWSTLPISVMVFGSMTTAPWLSPLMQRHGRAAGFAIGAGAGAAGAAIGAFALLQGNFWLFVLGAYFSGIYQSAQGFYRFAAADEGDEAFRAKGISRVMAAGLAGAIIGPQLVNATASSFVVPFLGTYLAIIAINLFGALLFLFLKMPRPAAPAPGAPVARSWGELLREPKIAVAIICGMVSYALMNLVMTSTPLAVVGCGFVYSDAANIVSAHVLAMFVPSFFTGHLIARFGSTRIVATGLAILALAGIVAMAGVDLANFYLALILLGIGWNFGFIGSTAMLTKTYRPEERGRVQGINDLFVFGGVTLASLFSGGLMNCTGSGDPQAGWIAVNLVMMPFLTLAGGALIWLAFKPKDQ